MRDHVKILAILNIVFGGVAALIGLGILLLFGGIAGLVGISAHNDPEAAVAIPILGIVGMGLFILVLICAVPGLSPASDCSSSGRGRAYSPSCSRR